MRNEKFPYPPSPLNVLSHFKVIKIVYVIYKNPSYIFCLHLVNPHFFLDQSMNISFEYICFLVFNTLILFINAMAQQRLSIVAVLSIQ